jgi:hypothetical protein
MPLHSGGLCANTNMRKRDHTFVEEKSMRARREFLTVVLVASLQTLSVAQTPDSFFPTHVGNLWQYHGAVSLWQDWSILQDSIASDGYRYLYVRFSRTGEQYWWYRLDSVFSVYRFPPTWDDTLYRLASDFSDVWLRSSGPTFPYYSWVYDTLHSVVFGRAVTIKVIRSGPFHPDSGGNSFYFTEQHLASGFGVIYHWEEPGNVAFLSGCIVAGDTFGTIVSVRSNEGLPIPAHATLHQNYPNPFNPSTRISFQLTAYSDVKLGIYDLLGREVAVLLNEVKPQGVYSVTWNAVDQPSGVYFYRLTTNDGSTTRRMLLLR